MIWHNLATAFENFTPYWHLYEIARDPPLIPWQK